MSSKTSKCLIQNLLYTITLISLKSIAPISLHKIRNCIHYMTSDVTIEGRIKKTVSKYVTSDIRTQYVTRAPFMHKLINVAIKLRMLKVLYNKKILDSLWLKFIKDPLWNTKYFPTRFIPWKVLLCLSRDLFRRSPWYSAIYPTIHPKSF